MTFVNHFYFYLWDPEWGPAFWKVNCYAPFPVWIWLNGHEWAKRQLDKARIGYAALDNGFGSCADPGLLQRLCDRLGPGAVSAFFWRWFPRLPQVFTTADLRAGYARGTRELRAAAAAAPPHPPASGRAATKRPVTPGVAREDMMHPMFRETVLAGRRGPAGRGGGGAACGKPGQARSIAAAANGHPPSDVLVTRLARP